MVLERLATIGLPLLAAGGLGFGLASSLILTPRDVVTAAPNPPAVTSLETETVAGLGEIQPAEEPIELGTPLSGVVRDVHVVSGDVVRAGEPLFSIDDRDLRAELALRERALAVEEAHLARLRAGTRPEDLPPARAQVAAARGTAAQAEDAWNRAKRLGPTGAISEEERQARRFALERAVGELARAQGELELLESGTWSPNIGVAVARVENARAAVAQAHTEIERSVVRAPVDGQVLRVDVRPGEYAHAGAVAPPLAVLAPAGALQVRVQIDEEDASRVRPGTAAEAFVRGRDRTRVALRFVRIEPRIVPKLSLTGSTTERVDTRVLFVVYEIVDAPERIYPGQKLDVFLSAAAGRD